MCLRILERFRETWEQEKARGHPVYSTAVNIEFHDRVQLVTLALHAKCAGFDSRTGHKKSSVAQIYRPTQPREIHE